VAMRRLPFVFVCYSGGWQRFRAAPEFGPLTAGGHCSKAALAAFDAPSPIRAHKRWSVGGWPRRLFPLKFTHRSSPGQLGAGVLAQKLFGGNVVHPAGCLCQIHFLEGRNDRFDDNRTLKITSGLDLDGDSVLRHRRRGRWHQLPNGSGQLCPV
jgi:hypothetical protein